MQKVRDEKEGKREIGCELCGVLEFSDGCWRCLPDVEGYISVEKFGLQQSGSQLASRPILMSLSEGPGAATAQARVLIYAPVVLVLVPGVRNTHSTAQHSKHSGTSSAVQSEKREECRSDT